MITAELTAEIEKLDTYYITDKEGNLIEKRVNYDDMVKLIQKYKTNKGWHDSEDPPKENEYILLSFSNFNVPLVGRYEGGAYYIGDDLTTALSQDIYVNGWQELPKCRED